MAAAGTVSSTAGCAVPLLGGDELSPRRWVAASGVFDSSVDLYAYFRPARMVANEDELHDSFAIDLDSPQGPFGYTGVGMENLESYLGYGAASVVQGDFDRGEVADELETNGFSEADEHEGYTIWVAERVEWGKVAVGVDGNRIVNAGPEDASDPVTVVKRAIDVGNGDAERLGEESDAMSTVMDTLGTGDWTVGSKQDADAYGDGFDGLTANGRKWTIEGETSTLQGVFVFEDGDDAHVRAVENWLGEFEDGRATWANVDDPSVDRDGNAVVIEGELATDEFNVWQG